MARPSSWIHHVEAFIDTSCSSDKQAASLDAIAAFVKKDLLTIEALVKEMELYLTTTDSVVRSRGVLLLAEILNRLVSKSLDGDTVHSLIGFFSSKLADWQALHGALIGCLALLRRKHNVGMVVGSDARVLADSCLQNLLVQSLEPQDRKLCFELLKCLLDGYPKNVATLEDTLVLGICEAIDQEKDPRCLMIAFHLVEALGQSFLDPCGLVANSAGELFEILGSYFPIYFTHPNNNDSDIKRDDLSRALMSAFCSTPFFEPYAIPMLLDKLSSSLPLAKLDSLKYLRNCLVHYGAERMATHAKAIWSSLKDVIFNFPPKPLLSFTSESERDKDLHENQIAEEALMCLQTAILELNNTDSDLFINLVIDDEDLEMNFMSIIREKSYNGITEESQRKLCAVGSILCISAKLSNDCCNRVFQRFFSRLMDILGISANSYSGCMENINTFSKMLNFGALYICVELLGSCRELSLSAQESSSLFVSVQNGWCSLLQNSSSQLAYVLGLLVTSISSGLVYEDVDVANVCCGVKGLQLLATFPCCSIQISKALYEDILSIFMSVITGRTEDPFLWKLTLKALGKIGSFIEKFVNSEKGISYMNIVIEKIDSLLKFDDSAMSLSRKLEAVSCVGTSGQVFMSRMIQGLEKAIFVNFFEAIVEGHLECAETLVCLLDCYSSQVLPWCHITGKFEEIAVHFALGIWNQMEDNLVINVFPKQGVLDGTMMLMKLLVAGCTMEGQSLIVGKAHSTLSSTALFPSKESLLSSSINSEGLQFTSGLIAPSCREELIMSLYASVLIALRPETPIPEIDVILKLLTIFVLKGHVPAAQALGSISNKWSLKINKTELSSNFTLETALDIFFTMDLLSLCCRSPLKKCNYLNSEQQNFSNSCLLDSCVVKSRLDGLTWIGKGFLMRGHEKTKEIVMLLLKCLLSSSDMKGMLLHEGASGNENTQHTHSVLARSAADAFHVLLTDSEVCLSKKFHAVIRPLYKQRFFSSMTPILLSSIKEADSSITRGALYRAFGHVISDTPLPALITEAKKLIPSLLDALSTLSLDPLNKDLIYSLLLVLAGILMDENGKEVITEHSYSMVVHLVRLTSYPHMMLVRETAIQCLLAMSELPHARIYPLRPQVLQAVLRALDDPKRTVRLEAVRCRQAWASIASRSLHI